MWSLLPDQEEKTTQLPFSSLLQLWPHPLPRGLPAEPLPPALTEPRHSKDPPELRSPVSWAAEHSR